MDIERKIILRVIEKRGMDIEMREMDIEMRAMDIEMRGMDIERDYIESDRDEREEMTNRDKYRTSPTRKWLADRNAGHNEGYVRNNEDSEYWEDEKYGERDEKYGETDEMEASPNRTTISSSVIIGNGGRERNNNLVAQNNNFTTYGHNFNPVEPNQQPIRKSLSSRAYSGQTSDNRIRLGKIGGPSTDSVIVYLLTERPKDKRNKQLINFFQANDFYQLRVVNIPPPATLDIPPTMTEGQALEIYRFNKVLTESAREYPDKYTLVIKDSAVTVTTPNVLEEIIKTALALAGWDLFYLTRWLDACEKYCNRVDVEGSFAMTTIVRTMSPNGTQAIIFSPQGRNTIIGRQKMTNGRWFTPINIPLGTKFNEEITLGNLQAICTVPNVFEYDLFQSRGISDLAKLADCRRPLIAPQGQTVIPFIWFVIIVAIVLLALWALYILGPSNQNKGSSVGVIEVKTGY